MVDGDRNEASSKCGATGSVRVMVVDDDAFLSNVTCRQLSILGFEAVLANSGKECIDLIQGLPCDVILMDLEMPEMDGIEATQRIRQLQNREHNPSPACAWIIAYSSIADELSADSLLAAGFDQRLKKPANLRELEACLRAIPGKRKMSAAR